MIKEMIAEWRNLPDKGSIENVQRMYRLINAIEKECTLSTQDIIRRAASKVLHSPNSSKAAKTARGSALSQRKKTIYAHNMTMFLRD